MRKATRELEGIFNVLARNLPGSRLHPSADDPRHPGFYVIGLSIPKLDAKGFLYPLHLLFISFPTYEPGFSVQIARTVVVGSAARPFSLSEFLREWSAMGQGGAIIYEGDATPAAVRIAGQQAVLRFLQRRREIMEWYTGLQPKPSIAVWPLDPNFTPRICGACLVPTGQSSSCPACGASL